MEKMRLGMIGCGGRGALYELWQEDPRVEIVAGADTNEKARGEFSEKIPGTFVTDDYRLVLERDDVDAVAICTPDFLHLEHATAALKAGKDVFCEKPLATTIEDCDEILRTQKTTGRKLMVGFNMRFFSFVCKMKEIVDAGEIGEIKTVWIRHFVGAGGEWYYHDWHANSRNTTGLLLQKATHDIDVMQWICGSKATRVSAFGTLTYYGGDMPNDLRCPACDRRDTCPESTTLSRWGAPDDLCVFREEVDVEDVSMVNMVLDNGVLASYAQCHFAPDYERNYTFIGTKGRIESDEPKSLIYLWRRPGELNCEPAETFECPPPPGTHAGADPQIVKDFTDMVLEDAPPRAPAVAGRWSVATGVCATRSLRNGGMPVDVPDLPEDLRRLEPTTV